MKPEDPEEYIRRLEHGGGQPGAQPDRPFGAPGEKPAPGGTSRQLEGLARLAKSTPGRLLLGCGAAAAIAIGVIVANHSGTTVQGNLIMINSGAKDTINCNEGDLKLDGDNNTYTVTGHCRRLEISGSANKVSVDSADTIGVIGDDNVVTYHSGAPTINKTGNNDIVTQRPSGR
ncbi:DUF3060 domain-containing protein [Mycobacterium sp. SP-6446]|uniref:DUF3060 domain-containing protein n=1 Tax=Mycobacterium sp. SP-6446 TaxID=1834162 RepID=UPI00096C2913|nr:DUF3060 domain-containing protein [Mycobacterium sp. SP-6446]